MQEFRLNQGQSEVLKNFSGNARNLFVTGPGGTGKSVVLSEIIKEANRRKLHTAVLAPTAVAARLISGQTWHSFFGVGILQGGLAASKNRSLSSEDRVETLRDLDLLIIDEISFVREEELRLMSWILQLARGSNQPFGGVRTLLFGDFFQLPPVPHPGEFDSPHFAFQQSRPYGDRFFYTWQDANFLKLSLSENLRSVDPEYTRLLNLMRNGMPLSEIEKEILASRQRAFLESGSAANEHLWILSKNQECEHFNLNRLKVLSGPTTTYTASFHGDPDYFKYAPVPAEFFLKIGARVMLRKNEYTFDALNGDVGTVRSLSPESVQIELQDGKLVDVNRCGFEILDKDYQVVARIQQMPLMLAYAITVHKAQGQTITNPVVIDLSDVWAPGHAYVALSRIRHRDQLFLRGEVPNDVLMKRDSRVVDFYQGKYAPTNLTNVPSQHGSKLRFSPVRQKQTKTRVRRNVG